MAETRYVRRCTAGNDESTRTFTERVSKKESHPVRNSIIATVVGGVLLSFWPAFRSLILGILVWAWGVVVGAWNYLSSEHDVYGWIILILIGFAIPTAISLAMRLKGDGAPNHKSLYTKDSLFGANWHWDYYQDGIINLWCLCPVCESELVYDQFVPNRYRVEHDGMKAHTKFLCERCNATRVVLDGDKDYAKGTVEREIRRKIRTGEWNRV